MTLPAYTAIDFKTKTSILTAIAAGQQTSRIAKQFGVGKGTVIRLRNMPRNQAILAALRFGLQDQLSHGLAAAVEKAMTMLSQATDAKSLDACSRALLALEKVSASVSGTKAGSLPPVQVQIAVLPGWGAPKPPPVAIVDPKGVSVDPQTAVEDFGGPMPPKSSLAIAFPTD